MRTKYFLLALCFAWAFLSGCGKDRVEERFRDIDGQLPGPTSLAGSIARSELFRIVDAYGEFDGKALADLRTEDIENSSLGIFAPTVAYYKQVNVSIVTTWGDETIFVSLIDVPVDGKAGDVSVDAQDVKAIVHRRDKISVQTSADVKGNIWSHWNADLTKLESLDCRLEIRTELDGKPLCIVINGVE